MIISSHHRSGGRLREEGTVVPPDEITDQLPRLLKGWLETVSPDLSTTHDGGDGGDDDDGDYDD